MCVGMGVRLGGVGCGVVGGGGRGTWRERLFTDPKKNDLLTWETHDLKE